MKTQHIIPAASFLCAIHTAHAHFDHQTTGREPHALVTVGRLPDSSAQDETLKSFDRLPVTAGATYRVRPGRHVVVLELSEQTGETEDHPQSFRSPPGDEPGMASASQRETLSARPLPSSGEPRRSEVSRAIIVQAGRHYRLLADRFMPCHLLLH